MLHPDIGFWKKDIHDRYHEKNGKKRNDILYERSGNYPDLQVGEYVCLNVFNNGIKDVVMKEIKSIIIINVMTSNDRTSDQKKFLFLFTLKMMLIAFSRERRKPELKRTPMILY